MAEIIDITKRLIPRVKVELNEYEILSRLSKEESDKVVMGIIQYTAAALFNEVVAGLDGQDPSELDFYRMVDAEYDARKVKGCYFCDRSIDGNAVPFAFEGPSETKVCLTCRAKVKSLVDALNNRRR